MYMYLYRYMDMYMCPRAVYIATATRSLLKMRDLHGRVEQGAPNDVAAALVSGLDLSTGKTSTLVTGEGQLLRGGARI